MARKSKILEEITNLNGLAEKIDNLETLELDIILIKKINDNAMMIIDERINGYVLHSVESILLLVIFAILAKSNSFTEIYIFGCSHFES